MIVGIGTDIVNIDRINKIFIKFGDDFLQKNFHPMEIEQMKNLPENIHVNFLAKRFAAKEAFAKACGCGIGDGIAFKDIAVVNDKNGAPTIFISENSNITVNEYNIHISLSDDVPFAVAFVVISR